MQDVIFLSKSRQVAIGAMLSTITSWSEDSVFDSSSTALFCVGFICFYCARVDFHQVQSHIPKTCTFRWAGDSKFSWVCVNIWTVKWYIDTQINLKMSQLIMYIWSCIPVPKCRDLALNWNYIMWTKFKETFNKRSERRAGHLEANINCFILARIREDL